LRAIANLHGDLHYKKAARQWVPPFCSRSFRLHYKKTSAVAGEGERLREQADRAGEGKRPGLTKLSLDQASRPSKRDGPVANGLVDLPLDR
jgi:hypothetical protein